MSQGWLVNGWYSTSSFNSSVPEKPAPFQPATFQRVTLVAHCDWSKNPDKRWMVLAVPQSSHHWLVSGLCQVNHPAELITSLISHAPQPGCILVGFDFPIGLPAAYASEAGITNFISALSLFGHGEWAEFYQPALDPAEVNLHRPFYPGKPGSSKRIHLEAGLGISFNRLYRLCERAHDNRRSACPLFWTMGGQQVGKAAISGWQMVLVPALADPILNAKIWPFSGALEECCQSADVVIVETYPAEFYSHLGLSFSYPSRLSKRRQAHRSSFAGQLITWAADHLLDLSSDVQAKIQDGFGSSAEGEDQFDALVGLYGMINVLQRNHSPGEPHLDLISNIEGWIFGQDQLS